MMLPNLSRLSLACILALSFRNEIAAQSDFPSVAPSTSAGPTALQSGSPLASAVPSVAPSSSAMPTRIHSESPTTLLENQAPGACYSNLTVLFQDQLDDDQFVQKTYTLCPNTTFDMGYSDSTGDCCFGGQIYLSARKNTRFQCGEDGKLENNCLVRGGETHVVYVDLINDEDGDNVEFAGITFEDAKLVTLFLGNAGDITFIDCLFKKHINAGVAFVSYFNFGGRRLEHEAQVTAGNGMGSLAIVKDALEEHGKVQRGEIEAPKGVDRDLQSTADSPRQIILFDGCVFDANEQDEFSDFTEFGLITIRTDPNDVTIKNTIFQNNLFGNEEVAGREGYAVSNFSGESKVVIEDCCFINNDFIGFGAVRANGGSSIELARNAGNGNDDDLYCQFVSKSELLNPIEDSEVICIDFDLAVCPYGDDAESTRNPTSTPAPSPIPTPSPTRSARSNESSSAFATKKLGAALALMAVTISSFGLC